MEEQKAEERRKAPQAEEQQPEQRLSKEQQPEQPQTGAEPQLAAGEQGEPLLEERSVSRRLSACVSGLMLCLFVFLAASYVVQFSMQLGIMLWARLLGIDILPLLQRHFLLLSSIPMYCVAFPLTLLLIHWRFPQQRFLKRSPGSAPAEMFSMGPLRFFCWFAAAYSLMLLGNLMGSGLMQLVSYETPNLVEETVTHSDSGELLLFTVVCAPLVEELLLRRVLVDRLREFGGGTAVLLSALAFGLMHGNLFQFFYAFFLGVLFAYLYLRSGKLWMTVLLHMLINFMGGYLPQRLLGIENPALYQLANTLLGVLMLVLLAVGIISLLRGLRHLRLLPRELLKPFRPGWLRSVFWNRGMLVFLAGSLLLFWMSV